MTEYEKKLLNSPLRKIFEEGNLFAELLPFDEYHLIMAQSDILEGMAELPAVKTYFYRVPPFGGSYVIAAGLAAFLNKLDSFRYSRIVPYLEMKGYDRRFVEYASKRKRLRAAVYSLPENVPAFPREPVTVLETNLIDSRLLEGILLSEFNFASLSATKWHRIRNASLGRPVMEFGRRRAQNGLKASLYSYMAGIGATSNCEANNIFGIPSSGTMGHEYVQSFPDEFTAFDRWLEHNPERPCLLIDTLDTLKSGAPNASKAFEKHRERLIKAGSWGKIGFRIDSGDLAYLGMRCYSLLKKTLGTKNINIVLSNDLDEYSIESIFTQLMAAGVGNIIERISFGVGTKGVTAWGEPALGGVCKTSEINGDYILKISNNNDKTTIPGNLRSAFITDGEGQYVTTLIYFKDEDVSLIKRFIHPEDDSKFIENSVNFSAIAPRQSLVYSSDGEESSFEKPYSSQSLEEIRENGAETLRALDWSYKRTANPHRAKVSLSPEVFEVRRKMIRGSMISMKK